MKHIVDSFRVVLLVFVVVLTLSFVASQSAQAQTLTTLHTFDGTDGAQPFGSLVQAANGELYGITQDGGSRVNCGAAGCGTIFRIAPKSGTLTTLLNFCNPGRCWETGKNPAAGLVEATDLYLYGVTGYGGYNENGTVFKIKPGGKLTVLHHFDGTDGNQPSGPLVQAANGDFYGMTASGGANGDGTVFEITPSGTLTTLYSFCAQTNCTDGRTPFDGLVQATNGDFYGTTVAGGANIYYGTVFQITPTGVLTTLYSFCSQTNCTDGNEPRGLVQAADGNFYGTTAFGGAYYNNYCSADPGCGTVFEITPAGVLTTLYSFCSQPNCPDGGHPVGLVQATDGNFYGATEGGGANGHGTVFEITPSGTLTTLYSFCAQANCADGANPEGRLMQATNGNLYGTTYYGGANVDGTVFSLSVGLGPFVETLPTSGNVGATVIIFGNKLTDATSVTFNGTAATFTVVSSSEITTTVPTGATTGTVEVTIPSGTLSSNIAFQVP